MLTINLVCVGNLKESFSREEQAEYLKRLSAFCKINIVEIKEENKFDDVSQILEKEGKAILEKVKGHLILCDLGGMEISSEQFAKKMEKLQNKTSTITFVVGGSYGVSEGVKNACEEKISFSKMTFPHNLFRIMLLEQIYRGFTILTGKTYHK